MSCKNDVFHDRIYTRTQDIPLCVHSIPHATTQRTQLPSARLPPILEVSSMHASRYRTRSIAPHTHTHTQRGRERGQESREHERCTATYVHHAHPPRLGLSFRRDHVLPRPHTYRSSFMHRILTSSTASTAPSSPSPPSQSWSSARPRGAG